MGLAKERDLTKETRKIDAYMCGNVAEASDDDDYIADVTTA